MLALAAVITWRLALPASPAGAVMSEQPLPLPELEDTAVEQGPVVITVTYALAPGNDQRFLDRAAELRRVRRRTGATHWHLHRDLSDRDVFEEMFVVGSWEEHERQHERLGGRERGILDDIDGLLRPGTHRTASHALGVRPPRSPKR